jgi:hypothetical protein
MALSCQFGDSFLLAKKDEPRCLACADISLRIVGNTRYVVKAAVSDRLRADAATISVKEVIHDY